MRASPRRTSRTSSWPCARTGRRSGNPTFVYVPRAANVLRERERHIALLEKELATKNAWLEKALAEHESLMRQFAELQAALEKSNRWADELNLEIAERRARVEELQEELAETQESAQRAIAGLESDVRAKTAWAEERETAVQFQTAELAKAVEALAPHREGVGRPHGVGAAPGERGGGTGAAAHAGTRLALDEAGPQDRGGPRSACLTWRC